MADGLSTTQLSLPIRRREQIHKICLFATSWMVCFHLVVTTVASRPPSNATLRPTDPFSLHVLDVALISTW